MIGYASRSGERREVKNSQDRFLEKLYGSAVGRASLRLLTRPLLSKIVGAFLDTGMSRVLIAPFVRANSIDLSAYERCSRYQSYNDFFTRQIRSGMRPVDMNTSSFISPCDGKISVYPIGEDSRFCVKHSEYTLKSLLRSTKLAKKYEGGYCIIVRLCVDDYHRYCYVDDGVQGKNHFIPGILHTVNPVAVESVPVYKENSRSFTVIRSDHFGDIVQMEVGAMMVGRIKNHYQCTRVRRGEEKGFFEFGGSTVIILAERGRVVIDDDLLKNTQDGYETIIKMGEKIGTAAK